MKSLKNIVGAVSVVVGLFATGCATNVEPQEEQIKQAHVGSPTPTAEASGMFRIMCPWGSYYSFCSEADQKAASFDECDVHACEPLSDDCYAPRKIRTYECDGQSVEVIIGVCDRQTN
jgi:hypothetical protein